MHGKRNGAVSLVRCPSRFLCDDRAAYSPDFVATRSVISRNAKESHARTMNFTGALLENRAARNFARSTLLRWYNEKKLEKARIFFFFSFYYILRIITSCHYK